MLRSLHEGLIAPFLHGGRIARVRTHKETTPPVFFINADLLKTTAGVHSGQGQRSNNSGDI